MGKKWDQAAVSTVGGADFPGRLRESDLSLKGLDMPTGMRELGRAVRESTEKEIAEYKARYGDRWFEHWDEDRGDAGDWDPDMYLFNCMILYGTVAGCSNKRESDGLDARMRDLYGDEYESLKQHGSWDKHVADLLIADAIKTGKWRELPKELWPEYRERIGSTV